MSHLRIAGDNILASSTGITASVGTAVSSLPLTNLYNTIKGKYARIIQSTAGASEVTINFASPTAMNSLFLGPNNFTQNTTFSVKLYNGATLLYDSGSLSTAVLVPFGELIWGVDPLGGDLPNLAYSTLWLPTTYTPNKIVIHFNDGSLSYINLSFIWACLYVETVRNVSNGFTLTWVDTTEQFRTDDGSLRSNAGTKYRTLNISLDLLTETDRNIIQRYLTSKSKESLISIMQSDGTIGITTEASYTGIFKPSSDFSVGSNFYGYYGTSLTLEEV